MNSWFLNDVIRIEDGKRLIMLQQTDCGACHFFDGETYLYTDGEWTVDVFNYIYKKYASTNPSVLNQIGIDPQIKYEFLIGEGMISSTENINKYKNILCNA